MSPKIIKKKKVSFKLILVLLVGILIVFFLMRSNLLNIKEVNTTLVNLNCVDSNQVKKSFLNKNILTISKREVENKLKEKYFCLKSINLEKKLPSSINLDLFGREAVLILITLEPTEATSSALDNLEATPSAEENQKDIYLLDNEGVVFSKAQDLIFPKLYVEEQVNLGEKIEEGEKIVRILNQVKTLGLSFEGRVVSKYLLVRTNNMLKIVFSLDRDIDTQLASLQLILNEAKIDSKDQLEFIDLRFDKPIVRFAPKKNA